jgi:hypothetical protein
LLTTKLTENTAWALKQISPSGLNTTFELIGRNVDTVFAIPFKCSLLIVGCNIAKVQEVILQMPAYSGFPSSINGMRKE